MRSKKEGHTAPKPAPEKFPDPLPQPQPSVTHHKQLADRQSEDRRTQKTETYILQQLLAIMIQVLIAA